MAKQDASAVISGMGVGMSLIQSIVGKAKKKGLSDDDIHRLATPEGDELLDRFIELMAEQKRAVDLIDCDADPFIPAGWKVVEHQKLGKLEWDPRKVLLYFSTWQESDSYIEGVKLHRELLDKPVLNANVLDWLFQHPEKIPDSWKGKYTFFWGTIYRVPLGGLYVRCLYFYAGRWLWSSHQFSRGWRSEHPAAVLASTN